MANNNLTNKWIYYPWAYGYGVDYLVHPEDIAQLTEQGIGLGLAFCIEEAKEYIKIKYKSTVVRVKKEGVKNTLPPPLYIWGQRVRIKNKPHSGSFIKDIIWHHKE